MLAITVAIAIGLARPEFLVEMDAVAVVPEWGGREQIAQFVTEVSALGGAPTARNMRFCRFLSITTRPKRF